MSSLRYETSRNDLRRLQKFLGISDRPEDDLRNLDDARMAGTCTWFSLKAGFERWKTDWLSAPSVLWLSGYPGSGKSVVASHVVDHLERNELDCSYFFFKHGIATKSSLGDCLRSLAFQMALYSENIRRKLLVLEADNMTYEKDNERAIWRSLFLNGVLQAISGQTHYWVIDALDECSNVQSFFSVFSNFETDTVRLFITSRKTQDIDRGFAQISRHVTREEILISDTIDDIKSFVTAKIDRLSIECVNSGIDLSQKILLKSNGSFLWVRLVMQELENAWSTEAVEEILNETPTDMSLLYARTLENMTKLGRGANLVKVILKWTACASRFLTLSELQCAIKLSVNETVHNLDRLIDSSCGQLVFIDQQSRVQMIHQTAREFILQEGLESEFAVKRAAGHLDLAINCIGFLSKMSFKGLWVQKQKLDIGVDTFHDSSLVEYASTYFSDHLCEASLVESESIDALSAFLSSNVLSWIEYLAKRSDLHHITRTAMNIRTFLGRHAKHFPSISKQFQTVEAWSIDLIRVCAQFGAVLSTSPSSIYWLIPPVCPRESIIFQTFASPHRGLAVKGLKASTWDDCLTKISHPNYWATAVTFGDSYFAIGMSTGKTMVYQIMSSQLHHTLEHSERVKILKFGIQDQVLASSGLRTIRIWNISDGNQTWVFQTTHQALLLAFTSKNECLLAATQGDYITCLGLLDGGEKGRVSWHDSFEKGNSKVQRHQPPTHASLSPDRNLLAISYRGRPVFFFDINSEVFFGDCVRENDLDINSGGAYYPISAMVFNPSYEVHLLIVAYDDGELITYNSRTVGLKHRVAAVNAQALACSNDGRTLVTGSPFGIIQLFSFDGPEGESLTLIYRIKTHEGGIKSIAFSHDCLRFIDICGSQCRVWEPAILVRKNLQDRNQNDANGPLSTIIQSVEIEQEEIEEEITAMTCHVDGDVIFCGKRNGSVAAYQTQNGNEICILYKHAANISITAIAWGGVQGILASADESSRVIIRKIVKHQKDWSASDVLADERLGDSISSLLMSSSNDRLLVSGKYSDDLWTNQAQKLRSKKFSPQTLRKAISHPSRPDSFIIIERDVARFFRWTDFEEISYLEGLRTSLAAEPLVSNSILNNPQQGIVVIAGLLRHHKDRSSAKLECWHISDLQASHASITQLPGFDMLGPSIEHVIGVSGSRLLFLDTDLWVCSLDLISFVKVTQVRRHFFIPLDWVDSSREILFQLTSKNELVLARKEMLVTIQMWMDYSEEISLSVQPSTDHRG